MEKTVYQGKFVKVIEQKIDHYTWEKVYLPDSLVVFPITENNEILMIQEKRPHEEPPYRLKFVTGHIDQGETPKDCAQREMQEEIGYKAQLIEQIMIHNSSGTINSKFYYFLAKDLSISKLPNPDGEETIMSIERIKVKDIMKMLESGQMNWTLSTLGLLKALNQQMLNT